MADQDNEKRLDQLLDSLLTTYSDVQPRPGELLGQLHITFHDRRFRCGFHAT